MPNESKPEPQQIKDLQDLPEEEVQKEGEEVKGGTVSTFTQTYNNTMKQIINGIKA